MKLLKYIIIGAVAAFSMQSCSDDEWGNGDPAMENVFYVGFHDWGNLKNDVTFSVAQGDTIWIPIQFFSERVRAFDVTTYYYVTGSMTLGSDFQIIDQQGQSISANANGAYELTWPEARKGIQFVRVKALEGGNKGTLTVQTFNPAEPEAISTTHTPNNLTSQYEVHAFSQNYKVAVDIQ